MANNISFETISPPPHIFPFAQGSPTPLGSPRKNSTFLLFWIEESLSAAAPVLLDFIETWSTFLENLNKPWGATKIDIKGGGVAERGIGKGIWVEGIRKSNNRMNI